ncbi:MAG: hypothetical protein QF441_03780 [Bacteriovoracaceae bacterium]|jgi:predicted transcriptional regulator|nr:hypothetical protein [Halobacteriovoraceae bacterium]MDP7319699.1 hypothetical protein [Bacteriovoracaceae bacterium]
MANRFSDWQKDLSSELIKSKRRRKLYFEALREEFDNDLDALRAAVRVIGLKEFSHLSGIPASNLSNYLKKGKDLKISTLKKMISPFGVQVISIPLDQAA